MNFASNESARDVLWSRVAPFMGQLRDEASRTVTASRAALIPGFRYGSSTEQWGASHAPIMGGENRRAARRTARGIRDP